MVNGELWGDSSSWVSYDNNVTWSPRLIENYATAYYRLAEPPRTSLPEGETIDLSCAPWGIGGDSLLCKLKYILPLWDANRPEGEKGYFESVPVDEASYGKPHPVIFTGDREWGQTGAAGAFGLQEGSIRLGASYSPIFKPEALQQSTPFFWSHNVFTNLNYSKILIVPYLITSIGDEININVVANDDALSYFALHQLTSNWDSIEGKKAIKGIMFNVYCGSAGARINTGAKLQFNLPQLYPEIPNVVPNLGTPNPSVDTETFISNGWSPSSWQGAYKGRLMSAVTSSLQFYSNLTDVDKSKQWWSWHGNPVSFMDDNWKIYWGQRNSAYTARPIFDYEGKTPEQVYNYFVKQVALLGFPFCIDPNDVQKEIGEDNSICLPVFDSNGITTGQYAEGTDCRELKNFTWRDNVWQKNKYDPNKAIDDNDKGDLHNVGTFNYFPSPYKAYVFNYTDFMELMETINRLYTEGEPNPEALQVNFKGSNPFDYIVSAYATPCALAVTDSPGPVSIGPVNLTIINPSLTAYSVQTSGNGYFDCGTITISPEFNDFRDYAPYTTMELYVPLCGTIQIDPSFFMGHKLGLRYYFDYITMSCTAAIYRDNVTLYSTTNGTIGAQIPVSTLAMGDYQNNIHALETAQKQNDIRLATSVAAIGASALAIAAAPETGGLSLAAIPAAVAGLGGVSNTVTQSQNLKYEMQHTAPNVVQTGCADPQNAFSVGSMHPFLFIKRAKMLDNYDKNIYGDTVGFACCYQSHVKDESGLIVASDIKCDGLSGATLEEINMIKSDFANGVIV